MTLFVITIFIVINLINAEVPSNNSEIIWDSETFPNPLSDEEYFKCNIKNKTYLCDPENLLSETARMNIIDEIRNLQNTKNKTGKYCQKRGLIGAVAIANRFDGGNSRTLKIHANKLLKKWKMDEICKKSFLILIAIKDRSFWISKDSNIPIRSNFFTQLFNEQKGEFRSGNYEKGLINVIRGISKAFENGNEKNHSISGWIFLLFLLTAPGLILFTVYLFKDFCGRCRCGSGSRGYFSGYSSGGDYYSGGGSGGGSGSGEGGGGGGGGDY